MTVFWLSRNLHIISLSIFLSNTTALAEIGCLHQRLWRYNLVIIFLFRFINFCFLVYVIDSHFLWRVWQRTTTITRGYTYKWWEKYLSKRSALKHTCSWHDKLIVLWILNRQTKMFLHSNTIYQKCMHKFCLNLIEILLHLFHTYVTDVLSF